MKQKIYDIPIWESYELENCECPLCVIEKKVENDFIQTIFDEMVMDVRLNPHLVEEYRFCKDHFEKLYKYPDKFGLAILTERIFYLEKESLEKLKVNSSTDSTFLKNIFKKDTSSKVFFGDGMDCLICTKLKDDMTNYINILIKLWQTEDRFKKLYTNSRGFCLDHFKEVYIASENVIKDKSELIDFRETTLKLQKDNLERLHEELSWFITKFDYRFKEEPWKTSKDSLIRTIQKLSGNYHNNIKEND